MFFLCVGSFGNEFGSRMSVSGIVQLVLKDVYKRQAYRYNSNKEEATETVPCTIAEIDRQHTKRRYVRGMER